MNRHDARKMMLAKMKDWAGKSLMPSGEIFWLDLIYKKPKTIKLDIVVTPEGARIEPARR